jgi:hypothetical protein
MIEPFSEHPSEETLELFLFNRLPEEDLDSLETHVLACEHCVECLETLETQIAATRVALQNLQDGRILKKSAHPFSSLKSWFSIPKLSFAAAGAVVAAGAVLFSIPRNVTLTAYRGAETPIVAAGWPLHLHLNAAGLNPGPVAIELADKQGAIVWKGASVVQDDAINVTLPRIAKSGAHYLRLYSPPQAGTAGFLLREFALDAKWTL